MPSTRDRLCGHVLWLTDRELFSLTMINATPHHVGCAVKRLEDTSALYADSLGLRRRTRTFDVTSQHVRVCFLQLATGFYLELVSSLDDSAKLASFLKVGFYHLCFLVDDLETARERLRSQRFSPLPTFQSEAFAGAPCQFFVTPQLHLIELAQMSPGAFAEFFAGNLLCQQS